MVILKETQNTIRKTTKKNKEEDLFVEIIMKKIVYFSIFQLSTKVSINYMILIIECTNKFYDLGFFFLSFLLNLHVF